MAINLSDIAAMGGSLAMPGFAAASSTLVG
ncbi:hypothetical protein [Dictyobacter kobayashii]